jgi:hypothetical protein
LWKAITTRLANKLGILQALSEDSGNNFHKSTGSYNRKKILLANL